MSETLAAFADSLNYGSRTDLNFAGRSMRFSGSAGVDRPSSLWLRRLGVSPVH